MCEPVFLGADIGYANIKSFHDADQDCRISMTELANAAAALAGEREAC